MQIQQLKRKAERGCLWACNTGDTGDLRRAGRTANEESGPALGYQVRSAIEKDVPQRVVLVAVLINARLCSGYLDYAAERWMMGQQPGAWMHRHVE
jgi:hypothetical protein